LLRQTFDTTLYSLTTLRSRLVY